MKRGTIPTAKQIKAARAKYGLTQTAAAELVYYTLQGWQRIEMGDRKLHPAIWEYWLIRAEQNAKPRKRGRPSNRRI